MQRMVNLILSVVVVFSAIQLATAADDLEKAAKQVNGTWKYVSRVIDGEKAAHEDLQGKRLVLKDGKWTIYQGDEVTAAGTYKIVGLEDGVMQYDVTIDTGDNAGKSAPDICKLEGDTLTICIAKSGSERPTAFESKPGSGNTLTVVERVKP